MYYFAGDSFRAVIGILRENWFYVPAPFCGVGLFTVAYLFFRRSVILRVSDMETNRYGAYDISKRRFETMTVKNGVVNVGISNDGREVIFCKSVDFKANVIDLGDIHKEGENCDTMLTYREVGEGILKENRILSRRNAELSAVPYTEGIEYARAFVEPLLDAIGGKERARDPADTKEAKS